jgi:hypothetical protein
MAYQKPSLVHKGFYTPSVEKDFSWEGKKLNIVGNSLEWGGSRVLHLENEKLLMKLGS